MVLMPIWTYGIQLWGSASTSNIEILQRFQSKTLRKIAAAPWYVSNKVIQRDLQCDGVREVISKCSTKYQLKLSLHPNELATELLNMPKYRRLARADILDLPTRAY